MEALPLKIPNFQQGSLFLLFHQDWNQIVALIE